MRSVGHLAAEAPAPSPSTQWASSAADIHAGSRISRVWPTRRADDVRVRLALRMTLTSRAGSGGASAGAGRAARRRARVGGPAAGRGGRALDGRTGLDDRRRGEARQGEGDGPRRRAAAQADHQRDRPVMASSCRWPRPSSSEEQPRPGGDGQVAGRAGLAVELEDPAADVGEGAVDVVAVALQRPQHAAVGDDEHGLRRDAWRAPRRRPLDDPWRGRPGRARSRPAGGGRPGSGATRPRSRRGSARSSRRRPARGSGHRPGWGRSDARRR